MFANEIVFDLVAILPNYFIYMYCTLYMFWNAGNFCPIFRNSTLFLTILHVVLLQYVHIQFYYF